MLTNRIVVSKDLVQVLSPNSWSSSELKPNECVGAHSSASSPPGPTYMYLPSVYLRMRSKLVLTPWGQGA